MTVAELDISVPARLNGRAKASLSATFVRELGPADIALLASERETKPPSIKQLRDRHHALARALAAGYSDTECSAITGYDPSRISILKRDPTFQQLVSDYTRIEDAELANFQDRAATLKLSVVDKLQEAVDNDENPLGASVLLEIGKFAADRTGDGVQTKQLNVNANVDLGTRLRAARLRVVSEQ